MLYKSYQRKIERIAKIVDTVKKYKVLILSIIGTLLAVLSAFLAVKGMITSDLFVKEKQFVYGVSIERNANALFSNASYEYRIKGEDGWTDGMPFSVGIYEVRAVSVRTFGVKQYGQIRTVEIVPTRVEFSIVSSSITYGEKPDYTVKLVGEDKVQCIDFDMERRTGTVSASVNEQSVVIVDEDGNDVTYCYEIVGSEKNVRVNKRQITVKVKGAEKTYDGTPLVCEDYEPVDLVYSDEMEVEFNTSITNCGSVLNEPTVKIKNENGQDVTSNYSINVQAGTLTVKKRAITVTALATKNGREYDGEPLTCDGFEITEGSLVDGESITDTVFDGQLVDVGESDVKFESIKIINANRQDNQDVTDNYDYKLVGTKINVVKRRVTVDASGQKTYDGTELAVTGENISFVLNQMVDGQTLTVYSKTPDAKTFDAENSFWKVTSESGEDLASNYAVTLSNVSLVIVQKQLVLTACSFEKSYNGSTHKATEFIADGLVYGHYVSATVSGEIRDVGTATSTVTYDKILFNDDDVTSNYIVSCVKGTLIINKRQVRIIPSAKKTYDDTDSTLNASVSINVEKLNDYGVWEKGLYGNENLKADCSINGEGLVNADTYFDKVSVIGGTITIENGKFGNYEIADFTGSYTIAQKSLNIKTPSGNKEYNGTSQIFAFESGELNSEKLASFGLISGHKIQFKNWRALEEYTGQTVRNTVEVESITDSNGVSKFDNYLINISEGDVSISKRQITLEFRKVETFSNEKFKYEITSNEYFANNKGLVNSHTLILETKNGTVATYGSANLKWSIEKDGADYSFNYSVNMEGVSISVNKRVVKVNNVSYFGKEYDSNTFSRSGYNRHSYEGLPGGYLFDAENLLDEHLLFLTFTSGETDAGIYDLKYSYKVYRFEGAEAVDITDNYELEEPDLRGKLIISPKDLNVKIDYEKIYDGSSAFDVNMRKVSVTTGNGEEFHFEQFRQTLTVNVDFNGLFTEADIYVGKVINYQYSIKDSSDNPIKTENYNFNETDGDIIINKRPLVIGTGAKNFEYNGNKQYCKELFLNSGTLVVGHELEIDESDETKIPGIIKEGEVLNSLPYKIVDRLGIDRKHNYEITENFGLLTVNRREIEVFFNSIKGTYNGQEKQIKFYVFGVEAGKGLFEGDQITFSKYLVTDENGQIVDQIINAGNYKVSALIEDAILTRGGEVLRLSDYYNVVLIEAANVSISKANIIVKTKDVSVSGPITSEQAEQALKNSYYTLTNVYDDWEIEMQTDVLDDETFSRENGISRFKLGNQTVYYPWEGVWDGHSNYTITFDYGTFTVN